MTYVYMQLHLTKSVNQLNMKKHQTNKVLILDFYSKVLGFQDKALVNNIIKEDYIQHSPTVKTGKAGFLEFLAFLEQLPKSTKPPQPFFRFICEGDFVAVHLSIEFRGQKRAVLDLFRIEDDLLAEHWDASQEIISVNSNEVDPVKGPITIEELELTQLNKSLVEQFVQEVLIEKQPNWENYLATSYIEHAANQQGDIRSILDKSSKPQYQKLHRVIGEGNFVVTQSIASIDNALFVVYDIFRLKENQIVEHWSVQQKIPESMAHTNGMI